MKDKLLIGAVLAVTLLFLTGAVNKIEKGPTGVVDTTAPTKTYAEMKCDPCDYNVDYGDTAHAGDKGGVNEGLVKLECDPCDFNVDYGEKSDTTEK